MTAIAISKRSSRRARASWSPGNPVDNVFPSSRAARALGVMFALSLGVLGCAAAPASVVPAWSTPQKTQRYADGACVDALARGVERVDLEAPPPRHDGLPPTWFAAIGVEILCVYDWHKSACACSVPAEPGLVHFPLSGAPPIPPSPRPRGEYFHASSARARLASAGGRSPCALDARGAGGGDA